MPKQHKRELTDHFLILRDSKEGLWEFGQRAAITLPKVGFVTTTDIDKSALHPPDKQDIAPRMALELQRCAIPCFVWRSRTPNNVLQDLAVQ